MRHTRNSAPKIGPSEPQGGFQFADDTNKTRTDENPLSIVPQQLRTLHDVIESLVVDPLEGACETEVKTLQAMKRLATQLISLRRHPENKAKENVKATADHRALMIAADSLSKKIPPQEGRDNALFTTLSGALQNLVALKCPPSLKVETVDTLEEIKAQLESISPLFLTDYKERNRLMSALQGIRGIIRERETGNVFGRERKRRRADRAEKSMTDQKGPDGENTQDKIEKAPAKKRTFRGKPGTLNLLTMPAIRVSRGRGAKSHTPSTRTQFTQPSEPYMNPSYAQPMLPNEHYIHPAGHQNEHHMDSSYQQQMQPSEDYTNSGYQQQMYSNDHYMNSGYQQNQMSYGGSWNEQNPYMH